MSPFAEACMVLEACAERDVSMAEIAAQVARKYGINPKLIRSRNLTRKSNGVRARQEAMLRSYFELDRSTGEIGRFFGRDHSTVCHALKRAGRHAN
jgi:chromosomal replication initiator protein